MVQGGGLIELLGRCHEREKEIKVQNSTRHEEQMLTVLEKLINNTTHIKFSIILFASPGSTFSR